MKFKLIKKCFLFTVSLSVLLFTGCSVKDLDKYKFNLSHKKLDTKDIKLTEEEKRKILYIYVLDADINGAYMNVDSGKYGNNTFVNSYGIQYRYSNDTLKPRDISKCTSNSRRLRCGYNGYYSRLVYEHNNNKMKDLNKNFRKELAKYIKEKEKYKNFMNKIGINSNYKNFNLKLKNEIKNKIAENYKKSSFIDLYIKYSDPYMTLIPTNYSDVVNLKNISFNYPNYFIKNVQVRIFPKNYAMSSKIFTIGYELDIFNALRNLNISNHYGQYIDIDILTLYNGKKYFTKNFNNFSIPPNAVENINVRFSEEATDYIEINDFDENYLYGFSIRYKANNKVHTFNNIEKTSINSFLNKYYN